MTAGMADEPGLDTEPESASVQRFRKRPVVIEAMRWEGTAAAATPVIDWILSGDGTARYHEGEPSGAPAEHIAIDTLEGPIGASAGDWVVRGVAGEFYPCKPAIFAETYEPAADEAAPEVPSAARGRLARVEVKGFRDLGIVRVTESTLAGEPMLRAESTDGAVAEFPASSLHFITWLPEGVQVRSAEPAAIGIGDTDDDDWFGIGYDSSGVIG